MKKILGTWLLQKVSYLILSENVFTHTQSKKKSKVIIGCAEERWKHLLYFLWSIITETGTTIVVSNSR